MKIFCWPGIGLLLASCAATPQRPETVVPDTLHAQVSQPTPPAVKENMSMIGAALRSIDLVDSIRYVLMLELRTVLPSGGAESLAESGQTVTVYPDYGPAPDGSIPMTNERNRRLFDVRDFRKGQPVIGRISLRGDGKWYLFDTTLQ